MLRAVGEGRSFVLTNRGVPAGRIVPLTEPTPSLPLIRAARRTGGWTALRIDRKQVEGGVAAILDDLRGDR